jgi:hypothetical protein
VLEYAVDGVADDEKVPAAQGEHTRSAMAVACCAKKVASGQVADCSVAQRVASGAPYAEFVVDAEKLPVVHAVHVRSAVGCAAAA